MAATRHCKAFVYGKGVEGYKIVEEDKIGLLLKHKSKKLFFSTLLDEASRIRLARMGYLAICNYKGLIPDAGPKIEEDGNIESLLINAPKWFTPLTELPRL